MHNGITATVVDIGLVGITGHVDTRNVVAFPVLLHQSVCSTEDISQFDGRALRHVHHRTAGDTLLETGTVCRGNLSPDKVYHGGGLVWLPALTCQCRRGYTHAKTTIGTRTKDLHRLEVRHGLRDVYQHITTVLHRVLTNLTRIALPCPVDLQYLVPLAAAGHRPEVDKRIVHAGLREARTGLTCRIGIFPEVGILIVIVAITATEDGIDTSLREFYVSGSRQHLGDGIL